MAHQIWTEPQLKSALQTAAAIAPSSDFDLNANAPNPSELRPAAVLIALRPSAGDWQVIFTRRPRSMKHHPGQIAFPGGKVDPTDASKQDAALRESEEEIGLSREDVRILDRLPDHRTVTNFIVTPFVATIPENFVPVAEPEEVEEIFEVPLSHFLNAGSFRIESRNWRGKRRRFYVVPFGPYYIWGATARMLRQLAFVMENYHAH